jgi:chondroitin AC lyase
MDYDRDGVQARKAWFLLRDGWVALGAGITSASEDPITTSINQVLLKSDVLLLHDSEMEALSHGCRRCDDLRAVYHDRTGYYILGPQNVVVRAGPQTGTWTSIEEHSPDERVVTQNVFSLWIEHGTGPSGGTYAYRVVPGLAAHDLDDEPTSLVQVLANEPDLQAVAVDRGALVQAVFYAPGELALGPARGLGADAPCALVLRDGDNGPTLWVADPAQRLERVTVWISGRYSTPGAVFDPTQRRTLVTVDLPTGAYAGRTIVVELCAA